MFGQCLPHSWKQIDGKLRWIIYRSQNTEHRAEIAVYLNISIIRTPNVITKFPPGAISLFRSYFQYDDLNVQPTPRWTWRHHNISRARGTGSLQDGGHRVLTALSDFIMAGAELHTTCQASTFPRVQLPEGDFTEPIQPNISSSGKTTDFEAWYPVRRVGLARACRCTEVLHYGVHGPTERNQ